MYNRTREVIDSPEFVVTSAIAVGILGLVISAFINNPHTSVLPPLVILGAGIGYVVRDKNIDYTLSIQDPRLLLIGYFVLSASAIYIYAINGFNRTVSVHLLTGVLFLLAAILICTRTSFRLKFIIIVLTGLFHRGMVYYGSSVQMGNDGLFHNRMAEAIATSGTLAPLASDKYWYAPIYHLLTASGVSGFGVSARHSAFLLVTVTTTVLLTAVVTVFLERIWGETIALFGGWLIIVSDRAVGMAIHTTTTSLGIVFFALLLFYAEKYTDTGRYAYFIFFSIFLVGLVFTHQLSLFVAMVCISGYLCVSAFWRGSFDRRTLAVLLMLGIAFLFQTSITDYSGPESESGSFLEVVGAVMVRNLASIFGGSSERPESALPPGEYVALAGTDAMSLSHVAGTGLLFAMALIGAIYWMNHDDTPNHVPLGIGACVAIVSVFVYVLPTFGISAFLPERWQAFLYVLLALLAAPCLVILSTALRRHSGNVLAIGLILMLVCAPYTAVMIGNGIGAPDGPVFNDSPAADRLSTTPEEQAAYEFTVAYASEDSIVVTDHVSAQLLSRHYEQSASIYRTSPDGSDTRSDERQLFVNRAYADTHHTSYHVEHEDVRYRVYGPLPGLDERDAVVYTNGEDQIAWRNS